MVVVGFDYQAIRVPAGFEFDGASIPRFFWRVVTPGRPWLLRASCIHDFMYERALYTKRRADKIFKEILLEDGAPGWLANCMFQAVRLAGRGNYE